MRIKLTSVLVDDQVKALKFYTQTLGFVKSKDIPVGEFKFVFQTPPTPSGPTVVAVFDDTCDNLIQIYQE